jgi:hypothetical protein
VAGELGCFLLITAMPEIVLELTILGINNGRSIKLTNCVYVVPRMVNMWTFSSISSAQFNDVIRHRNNFKIQ